MLETLDRYILSVLAVHRPFYILTVEIVFQLLVLCQSRDQKKWQGCRSFLAVVKGKQSSQEQNGIKGKGTMTDKIK